MSVRDGKCMELRRRDRQAAVLEIGIRCVYEHCHRPNFDLGARSVQSPGSRNGGESVTNHPGSMPGLRTPNHPIQPSHARALSSSCPSLHSGCYAGLKVHRPVLSKRPLPQYSGLTTRTTQLLFLLVLRRDQWPLASSNAVDEPREVLNSNNLQAKPNPVGAEIHRELACALCAYGPSR